MDYIFNVTVAILKGSLTTLSVFSVTFLMAIPLGIVVALGRISRNRVLSSSIAFYTWAFRGTPLLLQLFFIYYGLPVLGIKLSSFSAAIIGFTINYTAYLSEIFRSGIQSVDKGQHEAARALGMSYPRTMVRIILPQAFKRVLPPVCNETITLVKDTALVSAIAMQDLLRAAKEIVTRDFTITPFIIAAGIYLLFTTVLVAVFHRLEKKFSYYQ